MPKKAVMERGNRYGRLVLLEEVAPRPIAHGRKERMFAVRCDCGAEFETLGRSLRLGESKSCGCLQKEAASRTAISILKPLNKIHGDSFGKLHNTWAGIKERCLNPNSPQYARYGGRGIGVCVEWVDDYVQFKCDMGSSFLEHVALHGSRNTQLDRVDNDSDYSPANCRWATPKQQANNRRNNKMLDIDGVTKTLSEWCAEYGMPYDLVRQRISVRGWDPPTALTTPPKKAALYTFNDESLTLKEWSDRYGLLYDTLLVRITRYGWPMEKALTTPVQRRQP